MDANVWDKAKHRSTAQIHAMQFVLAPTGRRRPNQHPHTANTADAGTLTFSSRIPDAIPEDPFLPRSSSASGATCMHV